MNDYDFLFKILVVGESSVGKTSLLLRYTDDMFNDSFMSTIGVDFKIKTVSIDGKIVKLQIWDTAGQERFRTITESYYRGAHAVLIVFDVTNRDTFSKMHSWIQTIKAKNGENAISFLIGNKADLTESREINYTEASDLSQHHNIPYIETSAKTSLNIDKVFTDLCKTLIGSQHIRPIPLPVLLPSTQVAPCYC